MPTSLQYSNPDCGPPGVDFRPAGEPREAAGEDADEDHAEPEVGHRVQRERRLPDRGVARACRAEPGGDHAEPRPDDHREHRREAEQEQRVGDRDLELVDDRLLARVRRPEVAVRERLEVDPELGERALVVAALVDDRLAHRDGKASADQILRRIAERAEEEEVEDHHRGERRERDGDPPCDGLSRSLLSPLERLGPAAPARDERRGDDRERDQHASRSARSAASSASPSSSSRRSSRGSGRARDRAQARAAARGSAAVIW